MIQPANGVPRWDANAYGARRVWPTVASSVDERKRAAGLEACKYVRPGMCLGLGTGSTVRYALDGIARLHQAGASLVGIPTSKRTEDEARRLGIPLTTLAERPEVDLTIDGADEIDPGLNLIKGGGGALLREKVVAAASRTVVIIADDSKYVPVLGSRFAVPVEIVAFAQAPIARRLQALGANPVLRAKDGEPYVTDNGNPVLDAKFASIPHPADLERTVKSVPGVVEVGIFTNLATRAILGTHSGVKTVKPLEPSAKRAP